MAAQQIGVVSASKGEVFARNAEGQTRRLAVGDPVFEGDVIVTAAGSTVEITPFDGPAINVAEQQTMLLDSSVVSGQPASPADGGVSPQVAGTAATVIQAENADFNVQLEEEAAAAGLTGGGAEGGHSFVSLLRIAEGTAGVNYDFPVYQPGTPPTIEGNVLPTPEEEPVAPVVSVSVNVGVGIGEPGEDNVITISDPSVIPSVTAKTLDIVEGTGGEGARPVTFIISLDKTYTTDVTVTYEVRPLTATEGVDYYDGNYTGTVTIPAGYIGFTVTQYIVQDFEVEGNEQFQIVLTKAVGATIAAGGDTATVTIVDDDTAPQALNDTNSVTEDTQITATGNVIDGTVSTGSGGTGAGDTDQDGNDLDITAITSASGNPASSTDGDTTFTIVGKYGTLVINKETGSYTYSLNNVAAQSLAEGQTLTDEVFTYTVADPGNNSDQANLTITITGTNDKPVIGEGNDRGLAVEAGNADAGTPIVDTTSTDPGTVTAGTPSATGTLTSSDVDVLGQTAKWSGNATGTYGTFAIVEATGVWTYTLNNAWANSLAENETKTETFTVTVTDDKGATDTRDVKITVTGANDSPVISGTVVTGEVQEDVTASASGQLSSSDVDVLGKTATWTVSPNSPTTSSPYGSIGVDSTGKWTYTLSNDAPAVQALAEDQKVTEKYTIRVTDDKGAWDDQEVVITITGTNDKPEISLETNSGTVYEAGLSGGTDLSAITTVSGYLTGNDIDAGDQISFSATGAQHGTVDVVWDADAGKWKWTYTLDQPVQNAAGSDTGYDSFDVTVKDQSGATASATVNISIIDDKPVAVDYDGAIKNDGSETLNGVIDYKLGADADGNFALSYTGPALKSNGLDVMFKQEDANSDGVNDLVGYVNTANGPHNVLTLLSDGQAGEYSLNLLDVLDQTAPRIPISFAGIGASGPEDYYDVPDTILRIYAVGSDLDPPGTGDSGEDPKDPDVNTSSGPNDSGFVGIGNNVMNAGEVVGYDFNGNLVNNIQLGIKQVGNADTFKWRAWDPDLNGEGSGGWTGWSGNISLGKDDTFSQELHLDGGYTKLELSVTDGAFKVGSLSYVQIGDPDPLNLSFSYTATDHDTDAVTGTFSLTVDVDAITALQLPGSSATLVPDQNQALNNG